MSYHGNSLPRRGATLNDDPTASFPDTDMVAPATDVPPVTVRFSPEVQQQGVRYRDAYDSMTPDQQRLARTSAAASGLLWGTVGYFVGKRRGRRERRG